VIGEDAFFNSQIKQLTTMTIHHSAPAVYNSRVLDGGHLVNVGTNDIACCAVRCSRGGHV
jgi:hypothetical protein